MRVYNKQFETAQLLNASFNGPALQINEIFGYSIQGVITGTPTGTVRLQMSSDSGSSPAQPITLPTHWTDIPNTTFTVTAAGDFMWEVAGSGTSWVRIVYTDGSAGASTATLTAKMNAKGF